jgi:ABC-type multidrug transport system ATPase subunit
MVAETAMVRPTSGRAEVLGHDQRSAPPSLRGRTTIAFERDLS